MGLREGLETKTQNRVGRVENPDPIPWGMGFEAYGLPGGDAGFEKGGPRVAWLVSMKVCIVVVR